MMKLHKTNDSLQRALKASKGEESGNVHGQGSGTSHSRLEEEQFADVDIVRLSPREAVAFMCHLKEISSACVSAPSTFRPAVRADTKAETQITCSCFSRFDDPSDLNTQTIYSMKLHMVWNHLFYLVR